MNLEQMLALKIVLVVVFIFLVIVLFALIYISKTYEEKLECIAKVYLEGGKELGEIIKKKDEEIQDLKLAIHELELEIAEIEELKKGVK